MPALFERLYRIQVGELVFSSVQPRDRYALSVDFEIERDLTSAPNDALVTLWNLSDESRGQIQAIAKDKKGVFCSVEAGYVDTGMSELFVGDLREARSYKNGEEWVTEISSGDGEKKLRAARTARTFPRGATLEELARKLIKDLGLGEGNALKVLRDLKLSQSGSSALELGGVTSGKVSREIDRILGGAGLEWSVQSGQVQITKGGELVSGAPSIVLREGSGLEGSPEMSGDIVSVTARLIPGLIPGYPAEIDSRHIDGLFRIERARYVGTWAGDAWSARLECKEV